MTFFCAGSCERVKGHVHLAFGVLAFLCAGYNLIAYARRREAHLGRNAVIYMGAVLYEGVQVAHHYRSLNP